MDEGSFLNDAAINEMTNFGCDKEAAKEFEHEGGCKENYFAIRDIKKGEEFRAWYADFAEGTQWSRFGLQDP